MPMIVQSPWPPPLAASTAAAEEAALAALCDPSASPLPAAAAPEEPAKATKTCRRAKRKGQRGTNHKTQPQPQPQPEKRTKEVDWKALCLLRLNAELCGTNV